MQIIFPVHLNPNIREKVNKLLFGYKNIFLIDPVDYANMIYLMNKSYMIITDSGGIQEEAPSLNKPLVIVRDFTERPEIIKLGGGILVRRDSNKIYNIVNKIINNEKIYNKMANIKNPYGDGKASTRITKEIKKFIFKK